MPRPSFYLLSRDEIELVYSKALEVLSTVGIKIEDELVKNFLESNGGVKKDDRTLIPEELAKEALKKAPKTFDLYDRDGKYIATLGEGANIFAPGSAAIYIIDHRSKDVRPPLLEDLKNAVIITDYLKNVDAQSTMLVPDDLPPQVRDFSRLYVVIKYSKKPVVTGAFKVENIKFMFNMMKVIRDDFNKRPWAIFDVTISSPLSWSKITARNLYDLAKEGIPAEIISMPQLSATAPATVSGGLLLHTAEVISGIAIAELVSPGSPIIYGGSTAVLQPRYGIPIITAPESVLLSLAYAEIAKYLRLPSHTYLGLSDNKIIDYQAGAETVYSAVLAVLEKFDIISGPGMLENELTQSLEKLILDDEVVGIAKRIAKGFSLSADELLQDIDEIKDGINKRHFLSSPRTRKLVREFHAYSIFDITTRSTWNKKEVHDKAHDKVLEILKTYTPTMLDKDLIKRVEEAYASAWKYYNLGNPKLV